MANENILNITFLTLLIVLWFILVNVLVIRKYILKYVVVKRHASNLVSISQGKICPYKSVYIERMLKQVDKMSTRAKSKVENIRAFFIVKFIGVHQLITCKFLVLHCNLL